VAAERVLRDVWRNREALARDEHKYVQLFLGTSLSGQARFAEAEMLLLEGFDETERQVGSNSMSMLFPLRALAVHFRKSGDSEAAVRYAEKALEIAQDNLPGDSWTVSMNRAEYGRALLSAGRETQGKAALRQSLARLRTMFENENFHVRKVRESLLAADQ